MEAMIRKCDVTICQIQDARKPFNFVTSITVSKEKFTIPPKFTLSCMYGSECTLCGWIGRVPLKEIPAPVLEIPLGPVLLLLLSVLSLLFVEYADEEEGGFVCGEWVMEVP